MIERILLPLDGSDVAQRAVPVGVHLASASGARLMLMHGRATQAAARSPAFDVEALAVRLRESEAVGALTASRRISIGAVLHDAYPEHVAEAICASASEQRADLIVMSTHGHGGSGRSIYGSVASQVVSQSPIPIVLVPTMGDRPWPAQSPFRMLIPLDGSRFSEDVLGPGSDLARALQSEVILVGAVGSSGAFYAEGAPITESGLDAELRDMREYLDGVADQLRSSGLTVRTDAEVGRAADVVDGAAQRRHVDLIAMATHGRSGIARLELGSVASATLQRTAVPVFLVRPQALRPVASASSASAALASQNAP